MIFLVPIVTSLNTINNKVLSMFGHIPVNEINELANKCEKFIRNYLEDAADKRDEFSIDSNSG